MEKFFSHVFTDRLTVFSGIRTGSLETTSIKTSGILLDSYNYWYPNSGLYTTSIVTTLLNSISGIFSTIIANNISLNNDISLNGNIYLPYTRCPSPSGIIYKNGVPFIHDYCAECNEVGINLHCNNLFIGERAGNFTMGQTAIFPWDSSNNIGIGRNALHSNTLGSSNIAVGNEALKNSTTGDGNIAIGRGVLFRSTDAGYNVVIGTNAGNGGAFGNYNVAIGRSVLYWLDEGDNNAVLGAYAGCWASDGITQITTVNQSVLLGYKAKPYANGDTNEIVIGYDAVGHGSNTVTLGNENITQTILRGSIGIGGITNPSYSLEVSGISRFWSDVQIYNTLYMNADILPSGTVTRSLGSSSLKWKNIYTSNINTGTINDFITIDNDDLYIEIGTAIPPYESVTLEVAGRIYQSHLGNSTFLGYEAGANDDRTSNENVAIGYRSLYQNIGGSHNVAVGSQSLLNNTYGMRNIAIGRNALIGNENGCDNIGIGEVTLYWNKIGSRNIAIGREALANDTASENIGIGYYALRFNTTGQYNIAIGNESAYFTNTGSNNTAIGTYSLYSNTTGQGNITIGHRAGDNITTGSYNIIIGHDVDAPSATGDNQLNIGNIIYGDLSVGKIGIGTYNPGTTLDVSGIIRGTHLELVSGIIYPSADSTTAIQINKADGTTNIVNIDTTNRRIGIGTSTPAYSLTVNTTGGFGIMLQDEGHDRVGLYTSNVDTRGLIFMYNENGILTNRLDTKGSSYITGGNVGIGTTNPNYKLDVNGTFGFHPGNNVNPVDKGDVVIEATNNTTLTFKLKGSDGIIRTGTINLT